MAPWPGVFGLITLIEEAPFESPWRRGKDILRVSGKPGVGPSAEPVRASMAAETGQ
jgi:hypothetical protein